MPALCNMALSDADNSEGFQISDTNSNEINDHITDDESSEESFIGSVEIRMPKVAVTEKIIICIDISLDKDIAGYLLKNSTESCLSPMFVLKKTLVLFLINKVSLHKYTQFALVVIKSDEVKWASDFKNDPQDIINLINNLECSSIADEVENYNLSPVFQKIHENIVLPEEDCPIIVPPSEVYRAIIIYNSSTCIPKVDINDQGYKNLMASPYFVLDILYLHEKSKYNNCQNIYNILAGVCKNTSYVLEVSRSVTKVFNNFAKLLAHPFQRAHLLELR